MPPETELFPQNIGVVCHGGAGLRRFPAPPAPPASLLLLGPGVGAADCHGAADTAALQLPAARVLALLQPDLQTLPDRPEEIAALYRAAARRHAPRPHLLGLALEALPADAAAERRLLSGALARALTLPRAATAAVVPAEPPGFRVLQEAAWEHSDPHAVLEDCFAAFAAWRRQAGGDFEDRPAQRDMAHAVLETLLAGETLLVEAGPGTGKSLAYALPALLVSLRQGAPVVLSTQTRPLQEQLVARELPGLWACFGAGRLQRPDGRRGLRFTKLLGRSNYVCITALRRWVQAIQAEGGSLQAAQLVLALLRHPDGCLEDLDAGVDAAVMEALRSRRETCAGRECRGELPCPVHVARETARQADVLVVNHALLCADARLEGSLLGDWGAVVVDEAHDLERVATEALARRLGAAAGDTVLRAVRRLQGEVQHALAPEPQPLQHALGMLADTASRLRQEMAQWLTDLDAALPRQPRDPPRQRYRDADEVFGAVRPGVDGLRRCLQQLDADAEAFVSALQECGLDAASAGVWELAQVVRALTDETAAAFHALTRAAADDWVTYLDFGGPQAALRELVAAPLDVGPILQQLLGAPERAVVFTSATLCVDGDAGYVRRRLGVASSVPSLSMPAPFDYESQCTVACTASLGDYRHAGFVAGLAEVVAALHGETGRRMLVLLTSHRMLQGLYAALQARCGASPALQAQGISGSRQEIAARHVATGGSILLGTSSFWTGVDFPGEGVEILVLAKLPFAPPDDPLVEARCDRLRAAGEDAFESFVLPEALLRFRQGLGRLIRSRQDRGAVVLLDGRLETHPYGERFLAALPRGAAHFGAPRELVSHVRRWFGA